MNGVHIRPVENGYIIDVVGRERIATTLDEVLNFLLLHFEGKASTFNGDLYGYVSIARGTDAFVLEPTLDSDPAPAPAPLDTDSGAPSKPVVAGPPTFTCPICQRNNFQRMVGVIGHARGKHGQMLTAKDIRIGSLA